MTRKKRESDALETFKEQKERVIRLLQTDEFLYLGVKQIDSRGMAHVGTGYAGQDAIVLVQKGGSRT